MLLNLSNHPSNKWTPEQIKAANTQYGQVIDMPFPNIPPAFTEQQIEALANEYLVAIEAHKPTAVHLMGEMTFTYVLVNKLKAANIKCLASTTNRTVQEINNKKIVQFQFVQFRQY